MTRALDGAGAELDRDEWAALCEIAAYGCEAFDRAKLPRMRDQVMADGRRAEFYESATLRARRHDLDDAARPSAEPSAMWAAAASANVATLERALDALVNALDASTDSALVGQLKACRAETSITRLREAASDARRTAKTIQAVMRARDLLARSRNVGSGAPLHEHLGDRVAVWANDLTAGHIASMRTYAAAVTNVERCEPLLDRDATALPTALDAADYEDVLPKLFGEDVPSYEAQLTRIRAAHAWIPGVCLIALFVIGRIAYSIAKRVRAFIGRAR